MPSDPATRSRKRTEERLQESHDKLLEANAYLEGVLSSVTAGVITLEPDLTVRLANPMAADILGASRMELENRPLADWGQPLTDAAGEATHLAREGLQHFAADMVRHFRASPTRPWREQVELATPLGNRILLARGTPLSPGEEHGNDRHDWKCNPFAWQCSEADRVL